MMKFEKISASRKNVLLTLAFYLLYLLITAILFFTIKGAPMCGPGPNAILIIIFPFIVGILFIVNLIKTYVDRENFGSLIIHSIILLILIGFITN